MVNNNNHLVQILRLVDEVYEAEEPKPMGRGRPRTYQDLVILKVFIVMVINPTTSLRFSVLVVAAFVISTNGRNLTFDLRFLTFVRNDSIAIISLTRNLGISE